MTMFLSLLSLLILLRISFTTSVDLWRISPLPFRWTISGQILFLDEHQAQITSNSRLVIRLRDVSSKTNELKVIASNTFNASLFPIQYNITYNPSIIIQSHIHVIDAIILNEENIKTFQSDRSVAVNLLGPGRTTYIDISLRAVFPFDGVPMYHMREWPQLLRKKGTEAMEIIKKETGFERVLIVTDESQIPKDLRHDRVFIFIDENGLVKRIPSVG